jgi:tryptophan synthase alpha chain
MPASTSSELVTLTATFERCRRESRAAFIAFVPAGHPSPEQSLDTLLMLADGGVDIIELGIPFSDPLADGPIIQRASHRAILAGVDVAWTLDLLRRFRARRATPVVLFGYLNPVIHYGLDVFLAEAASAGAQGLLLTDLPAGADPEIEGAITASPVDLIRLIAPTTTPERARQIAADAAGFVYYVSRTGVTGLHATLAESLDAEVGELRRHSPVPVAVGFGISTPEQAAAVAAVAEGVVVGSALVERLEREGVDGGARLVSALRAALGRERG